MFCARCGKEIDNDSTFCPFCGQKVDVPVENKKSFQPSVLGNTKTVKLVGGIAAGLVILFGVIFGIGKLTDGSDTEETAEVLSPSVETQESATAELQKESVMESNTESSEPPAPSVLDSDEEDMYIVKRWDLCEILEQFFGLHLKCYVDYMYGNCNTEPVNISTMLEHTGVIGYFTIDDGMRVVDDYNDDFFVMQMIGSDLYSHLNEGGVHISCSVEIKEANIPETFRYYKGTDAVINAAVQLHYRVEGEEIAFQNNYALVSLVNSASNPEEWLLQMAAFVNESDYLANAGKLFERALVSENREQDGFADGDWKQIYIDYINSSEVGSRTYYCLIDVNGDQIPEILSDEGVTDSSILYYIAKDGSVNAVESVSSYSSGVIRCNYGRQDEYGNEIYQYNDDSGIYDLVLSGEYYVDWSTDPETYECSIDGVACSMEEYNERFDSYLKDGDGVSIFDLDMTVAHEIPLVNAIRNL